ncbi:MAG: tRNA (N(6)-L-threonylcarbamoyladenosine(37)-C(2))-methylthiotransferase MtaB [Oscillospiraceae bacterium]|nr:tRNA (N(6)-L-threonylcarbamoyladenosine(37)-C(2))-methylthiotransferase MtaB [Oscillospiraceae bacterium]
MKAAFFTLGCKVNQYETQILTQQFAQEGFSVVDAREAADVYVVNSCTVTSTGDKKTRQVLRRFRRANPGAVIALTGCYPQAFPEEASGILEADVVTGSRNRGALLGAIRRFQDTGERVVDILPHERGEAFEPMRAQSFLERTRAFVKIEDGCDRYCSYCIIPYARGPVRSKAPEQIRQELAELAHQGYQEIVLVGINLPSYGRDMGLRLIDAVKAACSVPGVRRLRLGSLEPELLTGEDLAVMASLPQFCPQFHLCLQSGCDRTLRAMNRHYDTAEYRRIAADIRAAFPNPSITTDIIVGFPGETEEDFEASRAFAKEMGFARAHVFSFSPREGTRAARMEGQVSPQVKEARSAAMIAATDGIRRAFLLSQVGRVEEVLFETNRTPYGIEGYTRNYTPVCVDTSREVCGTLRKVRITAALGECCVGELAD